MVRRFRPGQKAVASMLRENKKFTVIALLALAVILCVVQAEIWMRSTRQAQTETDKANIESSQPPSEIAGLAGTCLLVLAGVIASIPPARDS